MTAQSAVSGIPARRAAALGGMLILMAITWLWCSPAQAGARQWTGTQPARQFWAAVNHAQWLTGGERSAWRRVGDDIAKQAVKQGLNPWLVSDVGRACLQARLRPREFKAYCQQMVRARQRGQSPSQVVSHLLAAQSAGPGHHPAPPPDMVSRRDFQDTLRAWEGAPYQAGGPGRRGVDETGFVQAVYAAHGLHLPRSPHRLARLGHPVPRRGLTLGDLVVISGPRGGIAHLGIYLRDGWMLRADGRGGVLRVRVPRGRGQGSRVAGRRLLNLTRHDNQYSQARLR